MSTVLFLAASRTPQGVRGLKQAAFNAADSFYQSHSARSAWIETDELKALIEEGTVALRKECVD